MSLRRSALLALACVLEALPCSVGCSGNARSDGSAGASATSGASGSHAGSAGVAAGAAGAVAASGAAMGGAATAGGGASGAASAGAPSGGGATSGGGASGGPGGAGAAGGASGCSGLSQTRSARAGKSAGFSGGYQADYYPLYSHACSSAADCSAACVTAGGTQTSCAASECIDSTPDYCLPPTYWFDFDRLLTEGNTIESSTWIIMVNNPYRDQLQVGNFQFELPIGASIRGISFAINEAADYENVIADYSVRALANGQPVGLDRGHTTAWTTTFHPEIYGGAADLWGTSWTAEVVNAGNFGVALTPLYLDSGGNARAYVDFVRATVTYDACK